MFPTREDLRKRSRRYCKWRSSMGKEEELKGSPSAWHTGVSSSLCHLGSSEACHVQHVQSHTHALSRVFSQWQPHYPSSCASQVPVRWLGLWPHCVWCITRFWHVYLQLACSLPPGSRAPSSLTWTVVIATHLFCPYNHSACLTVSSLP